MAGNFPDDSDYIKNAGNWAIHAESGSVFPYVTVKEKLKGNMTSLIKTVYPEYRCPSKGIKGEVLRVNYSENRFFHPLESNQGTPMSPEGMKRSAITKPLQKVLLVDEPSESMRQTGMVPSLTSSLGMALKSGVTLPHFGKANLVFSDGQIEEATTEKISEMIDLNSYNNMRTFYWDPTK